MKYFRDYFVFFFLMLLCTGAFCQQGVPPADNHSRLQSPMEVVLAYVDAANRKDLEAFIGLYAPDIKKYQFPATLVSEGIDHMRKVYTKSFAEKSGIHVEIRSMIALGDKVISQDHVTGLPNGDEADETVIYQVENGLITNMVYLDRLIKSAGLKAGKK